jgi:2-keto-4-pentenoate hydratase/2-oxohepta-3-ene-1,7-dioic acid hydratase in catechol pathway
MAHVAGYCVINDVSEREFQIERGGTWDKGKGCDTFGPIGPVAGDQGRNRRPAEPEDVAGSQRQALPERQHPTMIFQGGAFIVATCRRS